MDSQISLALAAKLRMLFEKNDKYLAFPLGAGFTYRYLDFMKDPSVSGLTLQEALNNKGDFARLLNIIPDDGAFFSPAAGRFLWDAVLDALTASDFAQSGLNDADSRRLDEAIDFLTDIKRLDDGSEVPIYSVAVNKYYEYKTLYEQAEASYLDEKITVESSTGPEGERLRSQWSAYREKQLLDIKNQAEENWKSLGFREQVKNFQQVRNDLEPRKYLNLYKSAYLNEIKISETPDLNGMGIGFYTTFFSPFDAFEKTLPWTKITLTKSEMQSLAQNAPPDLKAIFSAGATGDDIETVSLEYNNVVVIRPWYKPEFFASRYWRLPNGEVISDGGTPRHGKIPGYVTSMIVVRNVAVTRKKTSPPPPLTLPIFTKTPLRNLKLADRIERAVPHALERSVGVKVNRPLMIDARLSPPTKPPGVAPLLPVMGTDRSSFSRIRPIIKLKNELAIPPTRASESTRHNNYALAKYAGTTIKSPILQIPENREELRRPPENKSSFLVETFSFDGVIVLAYLCTRTPQCPNPDPHLHW
jgi:hypothetical protein